MTHPLTDEILDLFGKPDDICGEGERIFFDNDMRAAYDLGRRGCCNIYTGIKLVEDYLEYISWTDYLEKRKKEKMMPDVITNTNKMEDNS